MASEETMNCMMHHDHVHYNDDDHHHHPHLNSLSRLSMCSSSMNSDVDFDVGGAKHHDHVDVDDDDDDDDYCDGGGMTMYMSGLSIESFDAGDADEEFSDDNDGGKEVKLKDYDAAVMSSDDSGKEHSVPVPAVVEARSECYSLPASPLPTRRRDDGGRVGGGSLMMNNHHHHHQLIVGAKEYASEGDAQLKRITRLPGARRRRRKRKGRGASMIARERILASVNDDHHIRGFSTGEESDHQDGGGGGGLMVITRPKGGRRSLCMDLDEVKACRDLGFELEHERMFDSMPPNISISASTLDTTSSGGNSPISSWRISSPGDDPRDVKARLKVWAQAVALVSTSPRHN